MFANCKKAFVNIQWESQLMIYERYWEMNHPQLMFPAAVGHFKTNRTEEEEVHLCDWFFCRKTNRTLQNTGKLRNEDRLTVIMILGRVFY